MSWKSIDELTLEAARSLEVNEMISESTFDLFSSMNAIELMDPKFDLPSDTALVDPFEVAKEYILSPGESLPLEVAASLVSGLLRRESAWCDGASLPESVFTCVPIHPSLLGELIEKYCPQLLEDGVEASEVVLSHETLGGVVATSYMLMTLRAVSIMYTINLKGDLYEVFFLDLSGGLSHTYGQEEDFSTYASFNLWEKIPSRKLVSLVQRVLEFVKTSTVDQPGLSLVVPMLAFRSSFHQFIETAATVCSPRLVAVQVTDVSGVGCGRRACAIARRSISSAQKHDECTSSERGRIQVI